MRIFFMRCMLVRLGAIGNATAAKNTQRFSVVNSALAPENNI